MRNIKENIILLIFFSVIISCSVNSNEKNPEKATSNQKANGVSEIKFDTVFHDFGDIYEGEKVAFSFKFKNTGSAELLVLDAYSTCGCTVPAFSRQPVLQGEGGKIEVVFDASNRSGIQNKAITVKINTPMGESTLWIKANVKSNN